MKIHQIIERFKKQASVTPELLLQMDGMSERNKVRLKAIKDEMGEKWILHPTHKKTRLDEPRPV